MLLGRALGETPFSAASSFWGLQVGPLACVAPVSAGHVASSLSPCVSLTRTLVKGFRDLGIIQEYLHLNILNLIASVETLLPNTRQHS